MTTVKQHIEQATARKFTRFILISYWDSVRFTRRYPPWQKAA